MLLLLLYAHLLRTGHVGVLSFVRLLASWRASNYSSRLELMVVRVLLWCLCVEQRPKRERGYRDIDIAHRISDLLEHNTYFSKEERGMKNASYMYNMCVCRRSNVAMACAARAALMV